MRAILLTQCVQNDFVRPLGDGEPLPNLVHVGRLEADRLCGPAGALRAFLAAAHALPPEELAIVHVVDRHDPTRDAAHLERFRPHCLRGSPGARLVEPIEALAAARPATELVEAAALNDLEGSTLLAVLLRLCAGRDPAEVPMGLCGVWTDAKVSFLAYDLVTRLGARRVSVCSALCASRSIDAHFRALAHLGDVLGVEVVHSAGRFLDGLVPGASTRGPPPDRDALFSELAGGRPALEPLGGGFSGSQVFLARAGGEAPATILKSGARDEIARERFGNERIGRVLGDVVPRLLGYREQGPLGAMQLELAQSDDPQALPPLTFKKLNEADPGPAATALLCATLEEVLGGALGRLYRTAEKDNADLLELYGFTNTKGEPQHTGSVVGRARAIAGEGGTAAFLERVLPDGAWLDPVRLYTEVLPGRTRVREILSSLVHGDLNLANVLLARDRSGGERPRRVWVIDFARLGRLPSLTDCAKIENDLAYILCPIADEDAFARAVRLQDARLATPTLEADALPALARTPAEERHARLVATLRRTAARLDPRGPAAMDDYRVALLRYAAHTLGFDEPTPLQKQLALAACARLGAALFGR